MFFKKKSIVILLITVFIVVLWTKLFLLLAGSGENYDWPAWNAWISVWREALTIREFPYYATYFQSETKFGSELNWGNNFFATPFIIMSPILLTSYYMPSINVGLMNFLVFLAISLFYFKRISNDLSLDYVSMATLAILWFFSGFILYRIAAGQVQLSGYLLVLPYIYINYKMLSEKSKHILTGRTYEIYFLLLIISLSAGFHIIQQWAILSSVILFKNKKALIAVAKSYLLLIPSIMYFLVPNILFGSYVDDASSRFMQNGTLRWIEIDSIMQYISISWGDIASVAQYGIGLVNRIVNTFIFIVWPVNINIDGSWENSVNIGLTGATIIILGLLSKNKSLMNNLNKKNILTNSLIILIMAYYGLEIIFNTFIYGLGIPAVDRLSVRMVIYAVSILAFFSISVIQNGVDIKWRVVILAALSLETANNLKLLVEQVNLSKVKTFSDDINPCLNTCIENIQINDHYIAIVNMSIITSLLSFIVTIAAYMLYRYKLKQINKKYATKI